MEEWTLIYSSPEVQRINILESLLAEQDIEFRELNKTDSVYPMMSEIELYVSKEHEIFTRLLIQQHKF